MRWLLLLGALCSAGCDSVFGLGDPTLPACVPRGGFDDALPQMTRPDAELIGIFSLTHDAEFGVYDVRGIASEAVGNEPPIPLPLVPMYNMMNAGLDPEGEYMLFTAAFEPFPVLVARRTGEGQWEYEPKAPKGSIAGTPSDSKSGVPVRVLVRLQLVPNVFQEYERTEDGDWVPVNDRFTLEAIGGANLSPDGMVMVYDGNENGQRGVYVTQRSSFDDTFGPGTLIFAGEHGHPHLVGDCSVLYTLDDGLGLENRALTKYVR